MLFYPRCFLEGEEDRKGASVACLASSLCFLSQGLSIRGGEGGGGSGAGAAAGAAGEAGAAAGPPPRAPPAPRGNGEHFAKVVLRLVWLSFLCVCVCAWCGDAELTLRSVLV